MLSTLTWFTPSPVHYMIIFQTLHDPELPKLHQHHLLTVSSVPLMRPLKKLLRTLQNKSLMLQMKMLLRLHPILVKLSRLTLFSPPRQTKLRKVRRREKERIKLINQSRIPLSLRPRKVPSAILSILVLFAMRITILKTTQGSLKLVVC